MVSTAMPWSDGEHHMHNLMNVPEGDNPTSSFLSPQAAYMSMASPLMAIGVLDSEDHPWTSIWGGENGFAKPLGGNLIGVRTGVDSKFDPVIQALEKVNFGKGSKKKLMVGGLPIDLMNRRRVKLAGQIVGGKVDNEEENNFGEIQLAINVEQSLGKFSF
jgi:hypothetical protein